MKSERSFQNIGRKPLRAKIPVVSPYICSAFRSWPPFWAVPCLSSIPEQRGEPWVHQCRKHLSRCVQFSSQIRITFTRRKGLGNVPTRTHQGSWHSINPTQSIAPSWEIIIIFSSSPHTVTWRRYTKENVCHKFCVRICVPLGLPSNDPEDYKLTSCVSSSAHVMPLICFWRSRMDTLFYWMRSCAGSSETFRLSFLGSRGCM